MYFARLNGQRRIAFIVACLAAAVSWSKPSSAKPKEWTVERFQGCALTELGDALSIRQTITTADCRTLPIYTASEKAPGGFTVDGWFFGVRQKGTSDWKLSLALSGSYSRSKNVIANDNRAKADIRLLRGQVGGSIVEIAPAGAATKFTGCESWKALGIWTTSCGYTFEAAFTVTPELAKLLRDAWVADPKANMVFRVFMSGGEEFDAEIMAAEFVAIEQAATKIAF